MEGTGRTIGGIVASQCRIPLGIEGNSLDKMKYFLPKATSLGDVLNKLNYGCTFLQVSSKYFGRTEKYLTTDKFHVIGLEDIGRNSYNEDDMNQWGISDDIVFKEAKTKYLELNAKKKHFALMLSTINTHHLYGSVPHKFKELKYKKETNTILNAVHCSDSIIYEFVKEIKDADTDN